MRRNRVLALASASLFLAVIGCKENALVLIPDVPAGILVQPSTVNVEAGKSADVTVEIFDGDGKTLSNDTWLPRCSVVSANPDVATVTIVGGKVRVVGVSHGSVEVSISCWSTYTKRFTVNVQSETPTLAGFSPNPFVRGTETLTLFGTGFRPGAIVEFAGGTSTAETVSPDGTSLTIRLLSTDTNDEAGPQLPVRVYNPPDGAWSEVRQVPLAYPVPIILYLTPEEKPAGSPAFRLQVSGLLFPTTVIRWAGSDLVTTPATRYSFPAHADVPASLLTTPGTYAVTAFTPGPGGGTSNPLLFTVTPPDDGQAATFDFSVYEPKIEWAAASMGSGPFVPIPIDGKIVQFQVTAPIASFAFVSSLGSNLQSSLRGGSGANVVTYQLTVFSMTREEMAGTHRMGFRSGTSTLSGSVTGLSAGQVGSLVWGNGEVTTSGTFSMANASPGPHSLAGYRRAILSIAASDRVFMRQNQASATGVIVDFNGPESAPVATATATLAGLIAGDNATGLMAYSTEPTCEGTRFYSTPATASHLVTGFPAAIQGANDVHIYTMMIINGSKTLQQTFYSRPLMAFAGTRPPEITPTVTNFASAPYPIKQAAFDMGSYNAATLFYSNTAVTATRGYLGGSAGTIRTPDLSGVAGWNSAWAPAPGSSWGFGVSTSTAVAPTCANGTVVATYFVSGSN